MAIKRDSLDQLLARLNIAKVRQNDLPTYEVIAALIKRIKELSDEIDSASSGGTTTIINQNFTQQLSLEDGGSSEEGMIVPGQRGDAGTKGDTGATGAQGPPFPALIYLESDQAEDVLPIPGPKGDTGATGATGAAGPQAIGFVLQEDASVEENFYQIFQSNGDSGNSGWALIETRTCTGNPNEDFINLGGYSEIRVSIRLVTNSVGGLRSLRVSTDNGSTYLAASGDYIDFSTSGLEANVTLMVFHLNNSIAARTGEIIIEGCDLSDPKFVNSTSGDTYVIPTASEINAVRVLGNAGGNLDAGTIYIFGR